jgi:hypothetical protein
MVTWYILSKYHDEFGARGFLGNTIPGTKMSLCKTLDPIEFTMGQVNLHSRLGYRTTTWEFAEKEDYMREFDKVLYTFIKP